jgi:hypothetical protein
VTAAYDKVASYGLRVHACIDGASHYVLYAKVAIDKRAETIYKPFAVAVQKFGLSLRVRSDFASEHVLIREHMERGHLDATNVFLVGSSVYNQVYLYLFDRGL